MKTKMPVWNPVVVLFIALFGFGVSACGVSEKFDDSKYEKIYADYSEKELLKIVNDNPNNTEALTQLGRYYSECGAKDPENDDSYWTSAFDCFRRAAEKGHVVAMYNLGVAYANGWGVETDDRKALNWWRRAAKQGYPSAQCAIGKCYFNGWCVEKDHEEAFKWFMKAAKQNDLDGILGVAYSYLTGTGVAKDEKTGLIWAKKASDLGDDSALQYFKDTLREDGKGK